MGSRCSFVMLLLMVVQFQQIIAKPFFTELICDYICDDDDDTSTQSSEDDYFGFFDICSCPTRRPSTTNTAIPNQMTMPANFNISLPSLTNGLNFRMYNNNGQWTVDLSGGQNGGNGGPPAGGPPPGGPTTLPPTTAAGGATTAAGTTAAATTAKK